MDICIHVSIFTCIYSRGGLWRREGPLRGQAQGGCHCPLRGWGQKLSLMAPSHLDIQTQQQVLWALLPTPLTAGSSSQPPPSPTRGHCLTSCPPACKSLQSCLTLCDPMGCSPPGSSVLGILQARILEWVPCPPRDLPHPGVKPRLLCLLH